MGKALMILNEPACGSERTYNGLRLAGALARHAFVIGAPLAAAADRL